MFKIKANALTDKTHNVMLTRGSNYCSIPELLYKTKLIVHDTYCFSEQSMSVVWESCDWEGMSTFSEPVTNEF